MRTQSAIGFVLIAALLSTTLISCGSPHPAKRRLADAAGSIIGGSAVSDQDPIGKMTALLINSKEGSLCTASIIGDQWLLTASHCVDGAAPTDLYVVFSGTFQDLVAHKTPLENISLVVASYQNPAWGETMHKLVDMETKAEAGGGQITPADIDGVKNWGDIAVVRIKGKIPAFKTAASLLPTGVVLAAKQTVTLAGYGRTGSGVDASYGSLNKVDVSIVDPNWGGTEVMVDNSVKGACHGDSGGPAYAQIDGKLYLFGVTSRGEGEDGGAQCVHNTVYTNALSYQAWIQQILTAP